jgi:transcription initiation factor TFIID subunit 2
MPPRKGRTPAKAKAEQDAPVTAMDVDAPAEVEEPDEPPASPAPVGTPWVPQVRRQHLELEVGVTRRAGGVVVGCATITCRPPPAGSGDVRLVMLHAHELMIDRVTIDDAPARVVRRGRVVVGDDGKDVAPEPSRSDPDPAAAKAEAESADPAACASAAADAASIETKLADGGECDELVLARRDAGTVASAPANATEIETEDAVADPPGTPARPDVVIKVWYAAGPAAGDALPAATAGMPGTGTGTQSGWSVPGAGALCSCVDDDGGCFLAAPGAAARPAAWFPCVDDGASLAHFSLGVTVDSGLVAVAPGVLTKTAEEEEAEEAEEPNEGDASGALTTFASKNSRDGSKKKRFAFSSGGVPTQAHTITLAVGDFAQKAIPVSAAAVSAFTAAAAAEERDAEREREKASKTNETGDDRNVKDSNDARLNAAESTAASATHRVYAPRSHETELELASSAVAAALREMEDYLGRAFPFPGGARFAFVPSDCAPGAGLARAGRRGGGQRPDRERVDRLRRRRAPHRRARAPEIGQLLFPLADGVSGVRGSARVRRLPRARWRLRRVAGGGARGAPRGPVRGGARDGKRRAAVQARVGGTGGGRGG